ncbi:hypothetical protein [Glycomyces sp. NPDC048151]|uniref:hypothetical protein n=1 Tax=Glycomyces sp. NPDC048151 TaxID=3364002 RepID=UPI0037216B76
MSETQTEEPVREPAPAKERKGVVHLVRGIVGLLACVLAVVAVTGAVAAYYARLELLDTDRFTELTANIAEDPDVQAGIASLITAQIDSALDTDQIEAEADAWIGSSVAPDAIESLVDSAVETLKAYIASEVDKFVASPQFIEVWDAAVHEAHSGLVSALEGENTGALQVDGDTLVVDLGQVVTIVKDRMVANGVELASEIPDVDAQYVLVDSEQVPELQTYVDRLNWAADWLPWIALGLLVVGFLVIPRRWVGALVVGVLGAVLAGGSLWGLAEGKTLFVSRARDAAFAPVTYDAFTDQLRNTYLVMLGVSVLVVLVAVGVLFLRRRRSG